ncbi:MAG: helix-turn-helix domain-containing protein [Bacteroidales bacterium]
MTFKVTAQLKLALDFVETTGENIFLTGKAGTGKTTFLHNLKKATSKRMVVVAPTGVAAIGAGGVTIHSFFQLSFGPQLPENSFKKEEYSGFQRFNKTKINIIKSLDLLVIDEISMVRADLLDGIDRVLRRFKNRNKPFGGVQLLMIGDLQQLAPIAKDDEWSILKEFYDTVFFFSSKALQQTNFISIELNEIFRQSDPYFINLLNRVRDNELDANSANELNKRYIPNFNPNDNEGYITLTTHNHQSKSINNAKLEALQTQAKSFKAKVTGDFPEHAYPTDYDLTLKVGAQVMFVKNDPTYEKQFFNGKIGTLEDIDDEGLYVQCPNDPSPILVTPLMWENTRYTINPNTKEIKEDTTGTFTQYPLKLAWAITIHKSQGLTFDRAIIDAQAAFTHGQVYVALSRCRTFEGLVLSSQINTNSIITDKTVKGFSKDVENNQPTPTTLSKSQVEYQKNLMVELFDFAQLQRTVDYTLRLVRENSSSFLPELANSLGALVSEFKMNIFDVSQKFILQINKIADADGSVQENAALQERIKKATLYFIPKLEDDFLKPFSKINYETDSLELESKAKTQFERITKGISEKLACLKTCDNGFNSLKYINARATAGMDLPQQKRSKKTDKAIELNLEHSELFNTLQQWRKGVADEQKVSAYRILKQSSLYEIANKLPCHLQTLKQISGIGPKKLADFGNDIIDIVKEYRIEKGLEIPELEIFEEKSDASNQKSYEISYEMFKQGKSIDEIAKERDMVFSTIAGHLDRYIASGDILITQLVDAKKIEAISNHFTNTDDLRLTPAKEALGDNYSFNELRWVLKDLVKRELVNLSD